MRKELFTIATALLLSLFSGAAQAQNNTDSMETPRYEAGGHIFSFRGHELGFGWGAGGRFTYNLNDYVAVDNEINFFLPDEGPPYATQVLSGLKVGKHTEKVGVFLKARPGFQTNVFVGGREQTRFAFDVGGVVEFYPNRHFMLRADASDVIIPVGNQTNSIVFPQRIGTTHNFQFTLGVGVRF